jgi:hypothetical protein
MRDNFTAMPYQQLHFIVSLFPKQNVQPFVGNVFNSISEHPDGVSNSLSRRRDYGLKISALVRKSHAYDFIHFGNECLIPNKPQGLD